MEVKKKKAFFDELYKLDDDSEGPEDTSHAQLVLATSKLPTPHRRSRVQDRLMSDVSHCNHLLGRTVSAPVVRASVSFPGSTVPALGSRKTADHPSSLKATQEQSMAGREEQAVVSRNDTITKGGRKRKQGQSFNGLPDSQQIFKGLSFFFFPNNDVAPARAFRIRKAMEWGAVWSKVWKQGITHIIMDKSLTYKDLLTSLKIQTLPPDIVLVNEDYPADCIRFRFVVNPQQPQYTVKGFEDAARLAPTAPTTPSETSLQLKYDGRRTVHLPETPSRTDGSAILLVSSGPNSNNDPDVTHVVNSLPSSMSQYANDALSEAIEEAQTIQGLPLDLGEDEDSSEDKPSEDTDGQCSDEEPHALTKLKDASAKTWQRGFACMTKHDGMQQGENPNNRTIEVLQQMLDYYDQIKDYWRTLAYRKAISALKKQSRKIMTAEEAFAVPFIGQRLADKIEEIVWTDRLRRLDNTRPDGNDKVLWKFLQIYGVGYAQASKWIEQGYRSVDDLLDKVDLTRNQRIGVEHLHDFQTRIPYIEVAEHGVYVRETIRKIDANIQVTIGGSYRRGALDCGDVDFIVTKPECRIEVLRTIMLDTVIPRLFAKGYLKAGLASTRRDDGSKWHGAATLPRTTVWRRVDFLYVPWDQIGAALIYFTGNDIFNRSIRLLASKKGLRLNQRGLWKDVLRGKQRERLTQGTLVEGKDEKKIFELLGVPWRPPEHRNC